MILPTLRRYAPEAIFYGMAGVVTKATGSFYRMRDDWNAPKEIKRDTLERETTMLAIAGASMMGIQLFFTALTRNPNFIRALNEQGANLFKKVSFKLGDTLKKYEPVVRLALAVPAFALAESISRIVGPREIWGPKSLALPKASPLEDTSQPLVKIKAKKPKASSSSHYNNPKPVFNSARPVYYPHQTTRLPQPPQIYFHA